ncbi:MAG: TonB-dependent receptor [Vicinamibacterales bacterium]
MRITISALLIACCLVASPAFAGDLQGRVTDRSGGVLGGALVRLLNVASGEQVSVKADAAGRFKFFNLKIGIYRVAAAMTGFSDASRTLVLEREDESATLDFTLEIGQLKAEVTVSADRGARDTSTVPLRTDSLTADASRELTPTSTGDAIAAAPGVTLVGSGPFQTRPRLRGLDSTRVLVLVDGERLNNARTATDRAGAEVGLVDVDSVERIEVLGGAGSVLYGTDALSGTINIITNRPRLTELNVFSAGFDGFYSSNEDGRRGTVHLGMSTPVFAVSFSGGSERFGDYTAGKDFGESSQPLFDSGRLRRADTIDDSFGFKFGKFPDPFNAPFTRTTAHISNSAMEGSSANVGGLIKLGTSQTLDMKYTRRRATNVGFPDFAAPAFFQSITLPFSNLDKLSATYTATAITPWLTRITATSYYQRQDRLLRNQMPVQFPAPSATFFPISVFRRDVLSDTRQQVSTPGLDVQATFLTHPTNVLTAGMTLLRDRSEDERTTTRVTSQIGQVSVGPFGPAATVLPVPVVTGPPVVRSTAVCQASPADCEPARVPDASFRDAGFFLHDEWTASPAIRVTAGLRMDRYQVVTDATGGYSVDSLVVGATPAIAPATLPNVNGDRVNRTAFTGEAGVVVRAEAPVSLFMHYVRSYRHPNLEELLFSGPATTGNIVPNIQVQPETGHNVDIGTRLRFARAIGSVSYFNNTYDNFISTEVVSQTSGQSGISPISQAINLAKVRIQGVEAEGSAPVVAAGLQWLPMANISYNRGTVLEGTSPLSSLSLAGKPQDNITPWKLSVGLRVSDRRERWWASYGVRRQGEVTRVSPLLSDSPFLIAQDLFGLGGFSVQRAAVGYDWRNAGQQLGLTLAVDNLADVFYREQFQFAPARGRTVTLLVHVRGNR